MESRRTSTASGKPRRNTSANPPLSPASKNEVTTSKILLNIVEKYKNCEEKDYAELLNKIQRMIKELEEQGHANEINSMVSQSPFTAPRSTRNKTLITVIGCAVKNNAYYLTKALLACGVKKDGIHSRTINNKNEKEELTLTEIASNNAKMLELLSISSSPPIQALPVPPSPPRMKFRSNSSSTPPTIIPATDKTESSNAVYETIGKTVIEHLKKDLSHYQQTREQQENEYDFTVKFTLFGKEFKFEHGTYSRTQKLAAVKAVGDFIDGKIPKGDLINHIGALGQGNLGKLMEKHQMLWQTLLHEDPKQTPTQGRSL